MTWWLCHTLLLFTYCQPHSREASRNNRNVSNMIFKPVQSSVMINTETYVKSLSDTITVCCLSASVEKNNTRRVTFYPSYTQVFLTHFYSPNPAVNEFVCFSLRTVWQTGTICAVSLCISMYRLTLLAFFLRSCQRHDFAS